MVPSKSFSAAQRANDSKALQERVTRKQGADLSPLQRWTDRIAAFLPDSGALALGIFGSDGDLIYANKAMEALLAMKEDGRPADALINPTFAQLAPEADDEGLIFQGILTIGDERGRFLSIQAKAYRRGDELFLLGEHDVAELERLNTQMTAMNREINNLQRELIKEKKALENTLSELQRTQAMLIHAEKMTALGNLVAGVAHEVNNPVSFVISNLHSLGEAFSDVVAAYGELEEALSGSMGRAVAKEICDRIRKTHDLDFLFEDVGDLLKGTRTGAERIKKIVRDLRTFSRLDEAERKTANIADDLQATLSLADAELRNRDIEVRLDMTPMDPILCYPAELNQVFMNLIVNAAQAMESGGRLTIRGRQDETFLHLEFCDTGPGIPEEIRKKVFDPFFTTKPVGSGTGLGLSLAHSIIAEKHGGDITVDSNGKQGACICIRLPRSSP